MQYKNNILELISKKKNNQKLTQLDFDYFIENILNGEIKDYQISSFLMSIFINKLTFDETFYLTKAMVENSHNLDYKNIKKPIIDKHSTGGIGDKVTLILSPILASFGLNIAKISGKGLGYTGGTIDKLQAVKIKTDYSESQSLNILKKYGFFIIEQNKHIVPSDKILYAIRDTSGTVENISLIVASIMSKKIVTNSDLIYLDVKIGDGGFFEDINKATIFAEYCIKIGKKFKKKVVVHLTNMDFPLGRSIGNIIEVKETIDFLNNNSDADLLKDLIYEFAIDILIDTKIVKNRDLALEMVKNKIINKEALNSFLLWAKGQGSDLDFLKINQWYKPKYTFEIKAIKQGYVSFKSNKLFGMSLIKIKGGRINKSDSLDYYSGIYLNKTINEHVNIHDNIITIYSNSPIPQDVISSIQDNIIYNPNLIKIKKMILKVIK